MTYKRLALTFLQFSHYFLMISLPKTNPMTYLQLCLNLPKPVFFSFPTIFFITMKFLLLLFEKLNVRFSKIDFHCYDKKHDIERQWVVCRLLIYQIQTTWHKYQIAMGLPQNRGVILFQPHSNWNRVEVNDGICMTA